MAKRRSESKTARPGEQLVVPGAVGAHRPLGDARARQRVERDSGVGLHVRVDADYDHVRPLPSETLPIAGNRRRTRLSWGLSARLLSGHAGDPSDPAAGDKTADGQPCSGDRCRWGHSAVGSEAT